MREEEEKKKLEKKGVKRKRPKLKNRFKRNAKNEQKLLKIQRRNLLRYKQLDMKTIWNEGRQYNTWNVTEIFKNFLYLGAGTDISKRCLMNMPNDSNILKAEKMAFYYHNNIRYILNMSGSPLQKELNGHTYPVDITFFHALPKLIPMNDIDTIDETMLKCLIMALHTSKRHFSTFKIHNGALIINILSSSQIIMILIKIMMGNIIKHQ